MEKKPIFEELEHKIKKLEESEKKYRQLFETAMVGIYRTRIDDGKFLAANQTLAELMGYNSVDQFVKEYVTSKHYTDTKRREELLYQIRSQGRVDGFEIEMTRTDGSLVTIEISAAAYPEHGYLEGVVVDITKRKQAENALWESERKYSALVQESPDAIISLDKIGNLLSFNPTAERISGFSAEEVIGKHFAKIGFLAKKSIPKALKEFALVITGTERPPFELTIMRKDKSYLIMEANPRLIKHKGEKAWVQVTLRDITDRKLVEAEKKQLETQLQQSQKMESIGTLAGGIAHDFNNILGIIIGNTELAMDDVLEGNPAHFNLEEIRTASIRAKDIVRQLLSFSRKTAQERKPIQIIPIIKDSLKFLRATIPTSIDIRQDIQAIDDTILADPTQIHQVMMNLCTNASHAMETEGIIEIGIENVVLDEDSAVLYTDMTPGNYVKVIVSDTGQGIAPEVIDRIFDPYFTTKEVDKGSGMGLSVVHGIIKSHGGAISVESELGKGTIFSVLFPVIEKQEDSETETNEEIPTGNERILFVDDEESMVYVGRYRLERLGYKIEIQTSPVQALKLFQAKSDQFDLVITDMTMPQMTGDMLVKEILKIRPDMPTILCTGFSEKIDKERSKELGISAYIVKPLDRRNLAQLVRKVLDNQKEEQVTGRILVIEDEPQMRTMLKQMLEDKGCDVVEASDGKEGIKLYRANPFDLIVTDIIMPEREGIEIIIELKKDFPDVKIIAISGGGRSEPESYLNLAEQLGAKRVFPKPIDREELLNAVRDLLK
jgi:PAS domain S-box-containing protein